VKELKELRPGDAVTRWIGGKHGGVPVELKVTSVTNILIICGDWKFNRHTGGEIDSDLGWDGIRFTGSILEAKEEEKE